MPGWATVPGSTHQVAIAGKVVDDRTGMPVSGVTVSITGQPPEFASWLAAWALRYGPSWESLPQRPDRARTAEDGCFRFIDLPDGSYTLSIALAQGKHRYGSVQSTFTVTRDGQGIINAPIHEILLPPTGVEGQIKGLVEGIETVLPLARVRVASTGEVAYGDAQGRFYLTGVELGTRSLLITAAGFQSETAQAIITEGAVTPLSPLVLNPTP